MNRSTFPTSIAGLASYLVRSVAWLTDNAARLGISPAVILILQGIYGDNATAGSYLYCKKKYDDASARKDSIVTLNLKTVSTTIKNKLREIYNDIPASIWTDEDRTALNRKTGLKHVPTHATVPIIAECHLEITPKPNGLFKCAVRPVSDTKSYNIPETADAVELSSAIVESNIRKASEMPTKVLVRCLGPEDSTTKTTYYNARFQFTIDALFAGYDLYCWARWINTRHPEHAGEWCLLQVVMIT